MSKTSVTRDTAWMIERKDVHLCYAHDGTGCCRWVAFTDPLAWRFKTKTAAEMVIAERGLQDVSAVSHGWAP